MRLSPCSASLPLPYSCGCECLFRIRNFWQTSRRRGIFSEAFKVWAVSRGGRRIFSKERAWRWLGAICFPMWSCWLLRHARAMVVLSCILLVKRRAMHRRQFIPKPSWHSGLLQKRQITYIIAYAPDRVISNSAQIFDRTRPAEPLFINLYKHCARNRHLLGFISSHVLFRFFKANAN